MPARACWVLAATMAILSILQLAAPAGPAMAGSAPATADAAKAGDR